MKAIFKERQRNWHQFEQWEAREKKSKNTKKTIQLISEWVDFFLSRHPRRSESPDVHGIQELQRSLSHISVETLELLSKPGFRKSIAEARADIKAGRVGSLKEVFKR